MDRIQHRRKRRHKATCEGWRELYSMMDVASNRRMRRLSRAWIGDEAKRHGMEVSAYLAWLDGLPTNPDPPF